MAETPNRFEREAEMARALGKLGARHKREYLALLGNPPDTRSVPESFWQRVQDETDAEILSVLLLIFMESAVLHGLGEMQAAPLAREWAQGRASETAAGFVRHSRELFDRAEKLTRVTHAEARAEFPGQPGPAIERGHELAMEIYQRAAGDVFGPERMGRIAQFETALGMDRGGQAAIRTRQVVVTAYWRHSEVRPPTHAGAEKLPCKVCTPNLDKPQDEWAVPGGPPAHPNCILPGNLVVPLGKLQAASKARYIGRCVEITLSSGRRLTVTENHPVLTPVGWQAAHTLRVRGDVLCATDAERISSLVHPDNDYVPTKVEQRVASLRVSSGVASRSMPVAPEDFHGDAACFNGDIEVVLNKPQLRRTGDAARLQHLYQLPLSGSLAGKSRLARSGMLREFTGRVFPATNSLMRRRYLPAAFVGSLSQPVIQSGVRVAARCHACGQQTFSDRPAAYPGTQRQAIFGLSGRVAFNDFRQVWNLQHRQSATLGVSALRNTGFGKPLAESLDADSLRTANFCRRFSRLIACDQISKIRYFSADTHVFDLQVGTTHIYACGGALVHNCDCFRQYLEDHTGLVIGENYGGVSTAKMLAPHLSLTHPRYMDGAAIEKMFRELTGREPTAEDTAECARIRSMTDEEFDAYDAALQARGE